MSELTRQDDQATTFSTLPYVEAKEETELTNLETNEGSLQEKTLTEPIYQPTHFPFLTMAVVVHKYVPICVGESQSRLPFEHIEM